MVPGGMMWVTAPLATSTESSSYWKLDFGSGRKERTKTMDLPSGAQDGCSSPWAVVGGVVSCLAFEPSASATQTLCGDGPTSPVTCSPSGEKRTRPNPYVTTGVAD